MFYCHVCKKPFTLPWKDGEKEDAYAARLAETRKAACPVCKAVWPRCECGQPKAVRRDG